MGSWWESPCLDAFKSGKQVYAVYTELLDIFNEVGSICFHDNLVVWLGSLF